MAYCPSGRGTSSISMTMCRASGTLASRHGASEDHAELGVGSSRRIVADEVAGLNAIKPGAGCQRRQSDHVLLLHLDHWRSLGRGDDRQDQSCFIHAVGELQPSGVLQVSKVL